MRRDDPAPSIGGRGWDVTLLDDLTKARLQRDARLTETEQNMLHETLDECARTMLLYESLHDSAAHIVSRLIMGGFKAARTALGISDSETSVEDEIFAMASGLVTKLVDDYRTRHETEEAQVPPS